MNNGKTTLTFEQVWSKHEARRKQEKVRKVVPYAAAVLLFALFFTAPVQAFMDQWIQVKHIDQKKNASFGYNMHSAVNEKRSGYGSVEEAEKVLKQSIVFPRNMSNYEKDVLSKEFVVGVSKETNEITSYHYSLRSNDRMIYIDATHNLAKEPDIWFETTEDLRKTVMKMDGADVTFMSIAEYNGGLAYAKKGGWKIVIQIIAQGVGTHEAPDYKEQEMVELIESIK